MKLNPISSLITAAILSCCSFAVNAQRFVPAVPVNLQGSYSRMMSNAAIRDANRGMFNNWRLSNFTESEKYNFRIKFKDSTEKIVKTAIMSDTVAHKSYIIYEDKALPKSDPNRQKKVYPNETLYITRLDGNVSIISGDATDSCWYFKVVRGPLNAYSYTSETESLSNFNISAVQAGNGPIQKLTPEVLDPLIKDDQKAYAYFLKKDYYKAILRYNKDHQ